MTMTQDSKIGRLALRSEGNLWMAYYALVDTMDNAILLGSIARRFIVNEERKQAFIKLMEESVGDIFEETRGIRPIWPDSPKQAPEHEKFKSPVDRLIKEQLVQMAERLEHQWLTPVKDEQELGKTLLQVAVQLREIDVDKVDRIDESLANQLSRSISRNSRLMTALKETLPVLGLEYMNDEVLLKEIERGNETASIVKHVRDVIKGSDE